MPFSSAVTDRERDKFRNAFGETAVRVCNEFIPKSYRKEDLGSHYYEAWNDDVDASESEQTWLIRRVTIAGALTIEEWALSGNKSASWTNRTTYFGPVPFANTYSVILDGTNDYVSVPHNSSLNFGRLQPFTFSAWVKSITPAVAGTIVAKFSGGFGYEIEHDTSGRVFINFQGGGTGNRIRVRNETLTLSDGGWHFVSVTYDGSGSASGMKVYIDGSTGTQTILNNTLTVDPINSAALGIGATSTGGTPRFSGFLDEVALWNVQLSASSVTELYNRAAKIDLSTNAGNYTEAASLISWWRMGDGDVYPSVQDNKGTNNGTLINGVPGSFVKAVP